MRCARNKLNLALLALVAGLSLLLLFPDREPEQFPALTDLEPAAIRSIRLRPRSGPPIDLERRNGHWWLNAPHRIRADHSRCEALTRLAALPSLGAFAAPADGLAEFGLAPPLLHLYLDRHELQFGSNDPVYHHRYVRSTGRIHLIPDSLLHLLIAPWETFVSPRLLPDEASVEALSSPGLRLARSSAGDWRVDGTLPGSAAPLALIEAWQEAEAERVLPAPEHTVGRRIQLRLRDRPAPLVFTQTDGDPRLLVREDLGVAYRMGAGFPHLAPLPAQAD